MKECTHITSMWTRLEEDVLKLNSDRSVTEDKTGFGGTLRDKNGEVKLVYTGSFGNPSVLFQELQCIKYGLIGSHIDNYKLVIASDSLNAIHILNKETKPPWHCLNITMEIRELTTKFQQ
ncbi:hypothetical protein IFM89_030795 [Coptis chinensis]|uniref:RNase H type-1 domain-containing protein n=1 Tax=Coptis chinensis TaxID=261450 RepID=A0A835IFB4_9MAGN|nr:hypothetical protein IFM89_030795 [Coptis chinensis]